VTLNEFHDEEVRLVLAVEVMDRGDVRVGQAREGVRLLAKPQAGFLVSEGAFGQDLQGHVAVELLIPGAEDLAHPAGPQRLDDSILSKRAADHEPPPT
jgi:hypothetical protein